MLTPNCSTEIDASPYSPNDSGNRIYNRRSNPDYNAGINPTQDAGVGLRSFHPGGATIANCDGSTVTLNDNVDPTAYARRLSIADGNP